MSTPVGTSAAWIVLRADDEAQQKQTGGQRAGLSQRVRTGVQEVPEGGGNTFVSATLPVTVNYPPDWSVSTFRKKGTSSRRANTSRHACPNTLNILPPVGHDPGGSHRDNAPTASLASLRGSPQAIAECRAFQLLAPQIGV